MGTSQSTINHISIGSESTTANHACGAPIVLPANKIHSTISRSESQCGSLPSSSSTDSSRSAYSSSDHDLMLQELMETYEVGEMLGKGGSGQVYEVTHRITGEKFACKVIHKDVGLNIDATLKTESEIMKRMQHESIAALHEIYETPESKWMIMELANAGSVQTALASASIYTEAVVANVFEQMLEGVYYLHSMGIVHRDIKQDNILCTTSTTAAGETKYNIKITDFGLSAIVQMKLHKKHTKQKIAMKKFKKLTEIWGTTQYFAPEVYLRAYGPQADVWSLGCVLYELLTGEIAFPQREKKIPLLDRIIMLKVTSKLPRAFETTEAWKELSADAQDLIKRMLTVDPVKRMSIVECLNHPWIAGKHTISRPCQQSGGNIRNPSSAVTPLCSEQDQTEIERDRFFRNRSLIYAKAGARRSAAHKVLRLEKLRIRQLRNIKKSVK